MSTPDDLSPLKAKPFSDAVDKFEELMTQSGRAFLLGAGCSRCAGLPLTAELTSKALASTELDASTKEILTAIQGHFAGAKDPNIEDYPKNKNGEFAETPSAYLNLLDPRQRYPLDPKNVGGALEVLRLLLTQSWR